jgi:hypothetical protein
MPITLPYDELCRVIKSETTGDEDDLGTLTPETEEFFRKEFDTIRCDVGTTFAEMFQREPKIGHRRVHDAINTAISWKQWRREPLQPVEMAFQGVYGLEAEVFNGGFHQFFFNSTGKYWPHILWAMQEAGDTAGAQRFTQVISIFPRSQPALLRSERWRQMESMERWPWRKRKVRAHFDLHDKRFYDDPFPNGELYWQFVRQRMPAMSILWA